jgi:dipeptidyl aminopeptidase/acylaminoacyl peptidase
VFDDVLNPIFSPDSQHIAYAVKQGFIWSVVMDGNQGGQYLDISSLVFSPDSQKLAFAAVKDKRWTIIEDGRVIAEDAGRDMSLEHGGKFMAGSLPLAINGHGSAGGQVAGQLIGDLIFNGLSNAAEQNAEYAIYGSGEEYRENHKIRWSPQMSFSPDGKRVVYTSFSDKKETSAFSVLADGKAGPEFLDIGLPVFSPDGKHIAYEAMTTDIKLKSLTPKWSMVVDGQAGSEFSRIFGYSPQFNPDGSLEFFAIKGGGIWKAGSLYRVKYIPMP